VQTAEQNQTAIVPNPSVPMLSTKLDYPSTSGDDLSYRSRAAIVHAFGDGTSGLSSVYVSDIQDCEQPFERHTAGWPW
jgi:hypothetical protein